MTTETRTTAKGHGIQAGDVFTYMGRNTDGPSEGVTVCATEGNRYLELWNVDTHKLVLIVTPGLKFWAGE